jgi:hypothetical protein
LRCEAINDPKQPLAFRREAILSKSDASLKAMWRRIFAVVQGARKASDLDTKASFCLEILKAAPFIAVGFRTLDFI